MEVTLVAENYNDFLHSACDVSSYHGTGTAHNGRSNYRVVCHINRTINWVANGDKAVNDCRWRLQRRTFPGERMV